MNPEPRNRNPEHEPGTRNPELGTAPRVLLAGVSTRAAAESAARAGFDVTALDAFADLDQYRSVKALSMARDFGVRFSPLSAAHACRDLGCDAAVYVSSFENDERAVTVLSNGRQLWGNSPAVLRRVRDPFDLEATFARCAIDAPQVRRSASSVTSRDARTREWLLKRRRSGGGHHVRPWRAASAVPRGWYLQERIDGVPGSIVFVAAGGRAIPIGVSRQIVGATEFGAGGFVYCGSILAPAASLFDDGAALFSRACGMMSALAADYELVGVNGVDFVAREGVPFPVEVNPRWSSSMELVERAVGLSVFRAHASACVHGTLPDMDRACGVDGARVFGKAVVYARTGLVARDTDAWLRDSDVRDVPRAGERIERGRPICTVFADARDIDGCRAALAERARRIYDLVRSWRREAA